MEEDSCEENRGYIHGVIAKAHNEQKNQKGLRNWNEEFQKLLESPSNTPEEVSERSNAIKNLSEEFVTAAIPVVKTIIFELKISPEKKTVPPLYIEGEPIGFKYVTRGMYVKLATNHGGLVDGDEEAGKSASHRLKGLLTLISCYIDHLHVPLTCIINFLGYTAVVSSIVPLSNNTLVYGTGDGGATVIDSDPKMSELMKKMAGLLNLKGHNVGENYQMKVLYTNGDILGHKGLDGRYYVIGTGGLMPPTPPSETAKNSRLYARFRPEMVKKNPIPLSSDAFSDLQSTLDQKENNEEIIDAYHLLMDVVIPSLASSLNEAYLSNPLDNAQLVEEVHGRGVNLRFLGKVRSLVTAEGLRALILEEMILRTCEHLLQAKLRDSVSTRQEAAASFFSLVFGKSAKSDEFWDQLKDLVKKKFAGALSETESEKGHDLKKTVNLVALFIQLKKKTGVKFGDKISKMGEDEKERELAALFESETPFVVGDVLRLSQLSKSQPLGLKMLVPLTLVSRKQKRFTRNSWISEKPS